MAVPSVLLPGDQVPEQLLPILSNPSTALKLGPGLGHVPPDTITPTLAGELCVDRKKNAIWVESNGGRYVPSAGDTVLAVVHHSSVDSFHCQITPYTPHATLPQLSFPGATKKTRPLLVPGSLVYARISLANKHMDPELECVHPSTGKADGLGELKGGMVFDISLGMARRLMMPDPAGQGAVVVLDEISKRVPFEVAVGRNGRIWIDAGSVSKTLAVGRAILDTDRELLGIEEQQKQVAKLLRGI